MDSTDEARAHASWAGTRRRWEKFSEEETWVRVVGLTLGLGLLILYLFPWEDAARWFRGAPRWQQVGVSLLFVVLLAVGVRQQVMLEQRRAAERDAEEARGESEAAKAPSEVEATTSGSSPSPTPTTLYPGRLDAQKSDLERRIGEGAVIGGMEATVLRGTLVDEDEAAIQVEIRNVSEGNRAVTSSDFRLQLPAGAVADIRCQVVQCDGELESVDVLPGGSASGNVYFNTSGQAGDFYVIWRPTLRERAIWKVTLP
ncbi:MAG: hypothetical protein M3O70_25125 [Actinomycetota bacterium]|nr:hypothetical protein [Actinomycetota bacterium]